MRFRVSRGVIKNGCTDKVMGRRAFVVQAGGRGVRARRAARRALVLRLARLAHTRASLVCVLASILWAKLSGVEVYEVKRSVSLVWTWDEGWCWARAAARVNGG